MIYLGTQGWSYKSWAGVFYPSGTPSNRYLAAYATKFKAIEIDSTFYGTPRVTNVEKWVNDTPDHFRFAAKFPKLITHDKQLQNVASETAFFLDAMSQFGAKLGPLCLQFAYDFAPPSANCSTNFSPRCRKPRAMVRAFAMRSKFVIAAGSKIGFLKC